MNHIGTREIATERLTLRRFEIEDAENMFYNWANDPEVTKYLTWPAHESVDTTETILKEWISKYDEKDFYQWAIELNDLEQPIGTISAIKTDERVESVEIGYCIGKRFWNNGYMTEALTAIIRFFINEVGAGRIWARHDTENPNSGKVMVAAGMDYEGTLRHAGFNNQGICDEAVYAKVRSAALDEEPEEETPEQQAVTTKVMGEDGVMRNVISDETIEGERERQIELLEMGRKVVQETRRWDDNKESSHAMRSKEDAQDYRYFPEPDLVPIVVSDEWIAQIKAKQPELRPQKLARYKKEYDIPEYDAKILTESKHMADIFEAATKLCGKPKKVSNWLMVETMRLLKDNDMDADEIKFSPVNLAKLVDLVDAGTINSSVAKEVFEKIFREDIDPEQYVEENGLKSMNDEGELKATIQAVIDANPQAVEDYHNGKKKAIGALVGQTMKATKGKANPAVVNKLLMELL